MKKRLYLFFASSFLIFVNVLSAQTFESVMETNWKGISQIRTDLTDQGYFICTERLYNINYYDDDQTFTGIAMTSFNLDEEEYKCSVNFSGYVNTETAAITITMGSIIYSDDLPLGLEWVFTNMSLIIYQDSDHPGYYGMEGKTSGQYYDDEYIVYSNYPYY